MLNTRQPYSVIGVNLRASDATQLWVGHLSDKKWRLWIEQYIDISIRLSNKRCMYSPAKTSGRQYKLNQKY